MLGVYGSAWNLCAQASKPLTALANRVIIPHLAEAHRSSPAELERALGRSMQRFLPACLVVCLGAGLFAPALFGLMYDASFVAGGRMGELFAIVVWFMILQQVPRCALLSLTNSRAVAAMSIWNAVLTVIGIVGGYALNGGWIDGAIYGNALGNVAGCVAGWASMRAAGLHIGRPLTVYSLWFVALLAAGMLLGQALEHGCGIRASFASASVTAATCLPLTIWVWRTTIAPLRARRGGG